MNTKLSNCLKDCEELNKKIKLAKNLEDKLSQDNDDFFAKRKSKEELKLVKEDIDFLKANIIASLKFSSVESEEDFEGVKTCIDLVQSIDYSELDEKDAENIINALLDIGKDKYSGKLFDYATSLMSYEYFNYNPITLDMLIDALHRENETGESNIILDKVFGEYYCLRTILDDNAIYNKDLSTVRDENELIDNALNHDFGKNVVKKISNDSKISKKYKDAVKRAYQEFVYDVKYDNHGKSGLIAEGASIFVETPAELVRKVGEAGKGVFNFAGDLVLGLSCLLAYPFDKIAMNGIIEDNPSKKQIALSNIIGVPGVIIHTIGAIGTGIIKGAGFLLDKSIKLATYPVKLLSKGILKMGKVKPIDRLMRNKKVFYRNILNVINNDFKALEDPIKLKKSEIIVNDLAYRDNVLTIAGNFIDGSKYFNISYTVDDDIAKSLVACDILLNSLPAVRRNKIEKVMHDIFGDTTVKLLDIEPVEDEILSEFNLILSNITTQKPVKIDYFEAKEESEDIELLDDRITEFLDNEYKEFDENGDKEEI